ncbi:amyloid beta A4 precursor protein-binding family B member 1-interacting protein, partial [Tachysurus ichikawai]
LIVKVQMTDGSTKTLMVDERQTVRDVLDNLFEKTHCNGNVDWCVCETNPELQTDRGFEDHENLVEPLSAWTRDSENKVVFQERKDKYEVFKNPQLCENVLAEQNEVICKADLKSETFPTPRLRSLVVFAVDVVHFN